MSNMIARHVRIDTERWRRIESLANEHRTAPNRLSVELAAKVLDYWRGWRWNSLENQTVRSCPFTTQAAARNMIAAGIKEEFDEICRDISRIASEVLSKATKSATLPADWLETVSVDSGGDTRGEA